MPPATIRRQFNDMDLDARVASGELGLRVLRSSSAPPAANQVPGTLSQFIEYVTPGGVVLAKAFRYLRPDGTIGGSGRPDPKWLLSGEEALIPDA